MREAQEQRELEMLNRLEWEEFGESELKQKQQLEAQIAMLNVSLKRQGGNSKRKRQISAASLMKQIMMRRLNSAVNEAILLMKKGP